MVPPHTPRSDHHISPLFGSQYSFLRCAQLSAPSFSSHIFSPLFNIHYFTSPLCSNLLHLLIMCTSSLCSDLLHHPNLIITHLNCLLCTALVLYCALTPYTLLLCPQDISTSGAQFSISLCSDLLLRPALKAMCPHYLVHPYALLHS